MLYGHRKLGWERCPGHILNAVTSETCKEYKRTVMTALCRYHHGILKLLISPCEIHTVLFVISPPDLLLVSKIVSDVGLGKECV